MLLLFPCTAPQTDTKLTGWKFITNINHEKNKITKIHNIVLSGAKPSFPSPGLYFRSNYSTRPINII